MATTTKRKIIPGAEFKLLDDDAPKGSFIVRFAKLDVVDLDGDVIPSGAIGETDIAVAAWQHGWGSLPVGTARTSEEDGFAVARGQFLLDTQGGADTYEVVKAMGSSLEWSFGFRVRKIDWREGTPYLSDIDIFEVSPVYRGAGIDTGTVDVKEAALDAGAAVGYDNDDAKDDPAGPAEEVEMTPELKAMLESIQEGQTATAKAVAELQAAAAAAGEAKVAPEVTADAAAPPAPEVTVAVPADGAALLKELDTIYDRAVKADGMYDHAKLHSLYLEAVAAGEGAQEFAGKLKTVTVIPAATPAPADEPQEYDLNAVVQYMITGDRSLAEKELRISEALIAETPRPMLNAGLPIPNWALTAPQATKADIRDIQMKAASPSIAGEAGNAITPSVVELMEATPFDGLDLNGAFPVISAGPRARRISRVTTPDPEMVAEPTGNTGYAVQADPGSTYTELTPHTLVSQTSFTDQAMAMAPEFAAECLRILRIDLDEQMWAQILAGDGAGNNVRGMYNLRGLAGDDSWQNIDEAGASVTAITSVTRAIITNALGRSVGREARYGRPSIICSRVGYEYLRSLTDVTAVAALFPRLMEQTDRIAPTGLLGAGKPNRMMIGPLGSCRLSIWGDTSYLRVWEDMGERVGQYRMLLRRWFDFRVMQPTLFYRVRED